MDLDGTLLDVSRRYHETHRVICARLGIESSLSLHDYWEMKRSRQSIKAILSCPDDSLEKDYKALWLALIETDEMLVWDSVFPFAPDVLSTLKQKHALWLVSLRNRKEAALYQVTRMGLAGYFQEILFVSAGGMTPSEAKYNAIAKAGHHSNSFFVGDTEVDIGAAKLLKIPAIAVLSGIRNRALLLESKPAQIIDDIRSLEKTMGL